VRRLNWWITDLSSFLMGKHSTYTIEAIEDSELLLLTAAARGINECTTGFERYQRFCRKRLYCFAIKSKPANRNC
jgi:hypothetical protein